MEIKDLTAILVVAMVGCILVAGFIPVVGESVTATTTFENDGPFNYGVFTPDDDYTLEYATADGSLIVNGEPVPAFNVLNKAYSIIACDNYIARYGRTAGGYFMQCLGTDTNGVNFADSGVTAIVTISEGKLSVTWVKADSTTVTKIVDFDEMYAIVPNENVAIMKVSTDEVYIKGDSALYASGVTQVSVWYNIIHFEGNYNDGITISSPNLPDATFSNVTWNIEPVAGYVDLYKLTSIEFDITYNDTVTHAVYSYFGVPSTVTAEKAIHADANTASIVSMIPFILIMGIVLMFVGVVLVRRYV